MLRVGRTLRVEEGAKSKTLTAGSYPSLFSSAVERIGCSGVVECGDKLGLLIGRLSFSTEEIFFVYLCCCFRGGLRSSGSLLVQTSGCTRFINISHSITCGRVGSTTSFFSEGGGLVARYSCVSGRKLLHIVFSSGAVGCVATVSTHGCRIARLPLGSTLSLRKECS